MMGHAGSLSHEEAIDNITLFARKVLDAEQSEVRARLILGAIRAGNTVIKDGKIARTAIPKTISQTKRHDAAKISVVGKSGAALF
jgi:hypothetical protein